MLFLLYLTFWFIAGLPAYLILSAFSFLFSHNWHPFGFFMRTKRVYRFYYYYLLCFFVVVFFFILLVRMLSSKCNLNIQAFLLPQQKVSHVADKVLILLR